MLIHHAPLFQIYFGDKKDQLCPDEYLALSTESDIFALPAFARIQKLMQLEYLFLLKQIHSASGVTVTPDVLMHASSFSREGDFLMIDLHHVGLGVMTADCLPIVFYDKRNHAVAIAHAGWRGSAQNIAIKTIEQMHDTYGTHIEQVRVFFGPSAKKCCYEVSDDFVEQLDAHPYADKCIHRNGEKVFFDVSAFNRAQLEMAGVKKEAFCLDYNVCTICDEKFYSHRRGQSGRQVTVVSLR